MSIGVKSLEVLAHMSVPAGDRLVRDRVLTVAELDVIHLVETFEYPSCVG